LKLPAGYRHKEVRSPTISGFHLQGEEALVPASFQFSGDKAVIGINRIILAPRPRCLVARLFERELDLASLFCILGPLGLHGTDRRLDAKRLKALDHLGADDAINPHAAERDAPIAAMVEMTAPTVITARAAILAAVGDVQFAAAVPASEETGQQRLAAPH
jgi:hypothetical protein